MTPIFTMNAAVRAYFSRLLRSFQDARMESASEEIYKHRELLSSEYSELYGSPVLRTGKWVWERDPHLQGNCTQGTLLEVSTQEISGSQVGAAD